MKKKIMTLMMGTLLLLTACGQTRDSSASGLLPVAAVQSAAQAITPVEEKAQEDTVNLPAEETVEEAKDVGDEETPNPTEDAETPSTKAEETPTTPTGEGQPDVPEQPTTLLFPLAVGHDVIVGVARQLIHQRVQHREHREAHRRCADQQPLVVQIE